MAFRLHQGVWHPPVIFVEIGLPGRGILRVTAAGPALSMVVAGYT
jgi:hypothetical protein